MGRQLSISNSYRGKKSQLEIESSGSITEELSDPEKSPPPLWASITSSPDGSALQTGPHLLPPIALILQHTE